MATLEFWYEFASTYSYPAAMRIEDLAARKGVEIAWRPFLLGPIFGAQGMTDSPFNLFPIKGQYMWRDIERQCARFDIPFKKPDLFPQNGLLAARIALVGDAPGWCAEFSRAVYGANFVHGKDISSVDVLMAILRELGLDADKILNLATSEANKESLKARVKEAQKRGLFGAPTFFAGDEMFWGNDRLEEALGWVKTG
ncbi:2-hydroxychromene-2-carboxylate isomerase [bacterium AH-315-P15]|nr:2-hydroxychromene-2-carboxylate isomerase [bacterium AH-315-P15]